jgi:lon-related putative ATP-dependent protease
VENSQLQKEGKTSMLKKYRPLEPDQLRKTCDPDSLGFESSAELAAAPVRVLAQERAVKALTFGMGLGGLDFNIYVAGPSKTGLTYITRTLVEEEAKKKGVPRDWCYVHNFQLADHPQALSLPAGKGKGLKKDIEELIQDVRNDIPEVFESDDYSKKKEELLRIFNQARALLLTALEEKVLAEGFLLNVSQVGMVIMPAKEGQPLDEETLKALDEEQKKGLRVKSEQLQVEMNRVVHKIRSLEKNLRKQLKDLDQQIALYAVGHRIEDLQEKYQGQAEVLKYLQGIKEDIIKNIDDFKSKPGTASPFPVPMTEPSFARYEVNVLVDHSETRGAPVIYETNPTYPNLFGSIEKKAQFGALFTDFTMIRPGALHRANGGYLIIKVLDLLRGYFSWEALKRSLKNKHILIEDLGEQLGLIATKSLKPEPIPLEVKIILIGDPYLYHLLYTWDQDFPKMFKIKAQLDDETDRQDVQLGDYAAYMAQCCQERRLRPMHKTGAARLIEYSSELAGRNFKLSLRMAEINDLLQEADYWAGQVGSPLIRGEDVEKAIEEKVFRSNLYEEKIQEAISLGDLKIETEGFQIGRINGLSIFSLGDYFFGRPSRITANVSLGKEGVVNIEREAKLSGNLHTKGVMILSGYLKEKYAQDKPLSLSASLAFEQSYGTVDGDSASGAELLALLSALSQIPLSQGIAVTGSVSQKGEMQPIGGVNQKIEGFFEVCKIRGLSGQQGVVIPEANIKDLMLKKEIIEAVEKGRFHVYAISGIEEGLEILTGKKSGIRKKDGAYPQNSLNARIETRLRQMNAVLRQAGSKEKEDENYPTEENGEPFSSRGTEGLPVDTPR